MNSTQLSPKQQAIKKAYGKYYDQCNPNEDGWFNPDDLSTIILLQVNKILAPYETKGFSLRRPESLNRIENNNDWIRIDKKIFLPTEKRDYIVGVLKDSGQFIECPNKFCLQDLIYQIEQVKYFTHYKPYISIPPKY